MQLLHNACTNRFILSLPSSPVPSFFLNKHRFQKFTYQVQLRYLAVSYRYMSFNCYQANHCMINSS